jgi:hypothetical protein
MSYTDLRDFAPEYTASGFWQGESVRIELEKLGGGTVGRAYEGTWRYVVTDAAGDEIARGQDLHTGTPKTHAEAALILADFLTSDEL